MINIIETMKLKLLKRNARNIYFDEIKISNNFICVYLMNDISISNLKMMPRHIISIICQITLKKFSQIGNQNFKTFTNFFWEY